MRARPAKAHSRKSYLTSVGFDDSNYQTFTYMINLQKSTINGTSASTGCMSLTFRESCPSLFIIRCLLISLGADTAINL